MDNHKKRDKGDESEKQNGSSYVLLCHVMSSFFRLQDCGLNILQSCLIQIVDGAPGWATCGLVTGAGSSMWASLGHGPGNSVCSERGGTSESAMFFFGKMMIKHQI